MEVDQARRLKELEQENGRLKRLVADQAGDRVWSVWISPHYSPAAGRWLACEPQVDLAAGRVEGASPSAQTWTTVA